MSDAIVVDRPLRWQEIAAVASGSTITLSEAARDRIETARKIVDAIVDKGIRGYGINTGVGALCDVVIGREDQGALSRNIIMSHACGVGEPLGRTETRAIMAAQVNIYARGASGIRLEIVEALCGLLAHDYLPTIPSRGSVGYLTHAASIGLVLIGSGSVHCKNETMTGATALAHAGLSPFVLQAKEGLSLVNGTPCASGLACVALARMERLMQWADAAAAMSYENLGRQTDTFAPESLALRRSAGVEAVGRKMRFYLDGSPLLAAAAGSRTQDPLSLRAVPQIHGAVSDSFVDICSVVDRELASVTDNPAVGGSPEAPVVHSQAHAVGAALGLAMDGLAVAAAELAAISDRRIERLVNPMVSGLPAFLATKSGVGSGFQVAQCTAVSLVAENRRLASPASLDGGITAALQEDMLTFATPAALKALAVIDNLECILAIELLAATQAYEMQPNSSVSSKGTEWLRSGIRDTIPRYVDDRPLKDDIDAMRCLMAANDLSKKSPNGRLRRSGSVSG